MHNELTNIESSYGASHAKLSSYVAGFVLSIILTLIPYFIASEHLLDGSDLLYTITAFALLQLFVQSVFFLHLNTRSKAKWNLIAFIFAIIMVSFLVIGTIWIMQNLSDNAGMSEKAMQNMGNLTHGDNPLQ
jgi:cytochrome o ubiquinol oxidase operon protein cyoD